MASHTILRLLAAPVLLGLGPTFLPSLDASLDALLIPQENVERFPTERQSYGEWIAPRHVMKTRRC